MSYELFERLIAAFDEGDGGGQAASRVADAASAAFDRWKLEREVDACIENAGAAIGYERRNYKLLRRLPRGLEDVVQTPDQQHDRNIAYSGTTVERPDVIERCVAGGGRELHCRCRRAGLTVWRGSNGGLITNADMAVDSLLRQTLLKQCPGYGWVSEESSQLAALPHSPVWIVDPIDGNYRSGRAQRRFRDKRCVA